MLFSIKCLIVLWVAVFGTIGVESKRHANNRKGAKAKLPVRDQQQQVKLVMGSLMCHESHILEEWISHHWSEGVGHFVLVDNCNCTVSAALLQPYIVAGVVSYFVDTTRYEQDAMNNKIILPRVRELGAEWLIIGDLDEFYYAPMDRSLLHVLSHPAFNRPSFSGKKREAGNTPPFCSSIVVPWVHFGSSGQLSMDPSVSRSNIWRHDYDREWHNFNSKTIVRVDAVERLRVHLPYLVHGHRHCTAYNITWSGISGSASAIGDGPKRYPTRLFDAIEPLNRPDENPEIRAARLLSEASLRDYSMRVNHYPVQSRDFYFEIKAKRGDASVSAWDGLRDSKYFATYDTNEVLDTGLAERRMGFTESPLGPRMMKPTISAPSSGKPKPAPAAIGTELLVGGVLTAESQIDMLAEWVAHFWSEGVRHFVIVVACGRKSDFAKNLQPYIAAGILYGYVSATEACGAGPTDQLSQKPTQIITRVARQLGVRWVLPVLLGEFVYAPPGTTLVSELIQSREGKHYSKCDALMLPCAMLSGDFTLAASRGVDAARSSKKIVVSVVQATATDRVASCATRSVVHLKGSREKENLFTVCHADLIGGNSSAVTTGVDAIDVTVGIVRKQRNYKYQHRFGAHALQANSYRIRGDLALSNASYQTAALQPGSVLARKRSRSTVSPI